MILWVSDTSPLIFMAGINKLEILRSLVPKLSIPAFVLTEIKSKPDIIAQKIEDACNTWITIHRVVNRHAVNIAMADLHQGEAEAIILSQETGGELLLMDDQDARRFALRCGVKTIGTLGLLLVAKKRGLISTVRPEVERLLALNFRIKPKLLDVILSEAGEDD